MSEVTVKQLADTVGTPVDRLLKQMQEAGLPHTRDGCSLVPVGLLGQNGNRIITALDPDSVPIGSLNVDPIGPRNTADHRAVSPDGPPYLGREGHVVH